MGRRFDKARARRQSFVNLINFAGDIMKGEQVAVTIRRETYEGYVDPLVEVSGGGYSFPEFVVQMALRGYPMSVEEASRYRDVPAIKDDPMPQWSKHSPVTVMIRGISAAIQSFRPQ